MEGLYEECSKPAEEVKSARKYTTIHVFSQIFLWLAIIMLFAGIFIFPTNIIWFFIIECVFFVVLWLLFNKWKSGVNVSFDYCLVSEGELRISRVVNVESRKLVVKIQCGEILQIGDVDNGNYERLASDPNTKTEICTSNDEAAENKFFMYILVENEGKKLYVLECREQLLLYIMQYANRSALEREYVKQDKKKQLKEQQ